MGSRFAQAVTAAITNDFEAQASAHGVALHARAVAIRAKDPLATFLADTFTRQIADRTDRAKAAHAAGDIAGAAELAGAALVAARNLRAVRNAVEGR